MLYELAVAESDDLQNLEPGFDYVVFSEAKGVISKHYSATDACKALAARVAKHGRGGIVILKRDDQVWRVF